jgi:5-methylcytosine-specific restriction endonuclease McrA|tara:strand:+ start:2605 stop:3240 length:636 start_codon:yes stop_codon:yes gene_type:complete
MGRPAKILKKEDLQRAIKMTRSNRAAARYLHVSFTHYKKYAKTYTDEDSGSSLYELHKNQAGKGIPKFLSNGGKEPPIMDLIEGRIPVEHFDPKKIKQRIIFEALIEEKCAYCGFSERRVLDTKVPLVLNHKDGNKKNWNLDNIEFLCYNHAFLYATSPITDKQVEAMEDYVDRNVEEVNWELDEHHIEHLKDLGLYQEEEKPGEKYISRQ